MGSQAKVDGKWDQNTRNWLIEIILLGMLFLSNIDAMAFVSGVLFWNCSSKFSWKTIHSRGFATLQQINAIIIEAIFLQQILVFQECPHHSYIQYLNSSVQEAAHSTDFLDYTIGKKGELVNLSLIRNVFLLSNQDVKSTLKSISCFMYKALCIISFFF